MSKAETGKSIPDLELPGTSGKTFRSRDLLGKSFVLYFYPKDNTPGCTSEGQDFRDLYPEFAGAGTEIFGISRDTLASHENSGTSIISLSNGSRIPKSRLARPLRYCMRR